MSASRELAYGNFVGAISIEFEAALKKISAEYNFDLGDEFEFAICDVLRAVLPQKYGVCRGFVVNRDGVTAGDDIIIYEQIRFPTGRLIQNNIARKQKIPIEAAIAYIEAKHTLILEGEADSSLNHALAQAAAVKSLCKQRADVPFTEIADGIHIGEGFGVSSPPDWPAIRNPFYAGLISRNVKLRARDSKAANGREIEKAFLSGQMQISELPDLICAGNSTLVLPASSHKTVNAPFAKGNSMAVFYADGLAFGVAMAHMFWAFDYIRLGAMPWAAILADALNPRI